MRPFIGVKNASYPIIRPFIGLNKSERNPNIAFHSKGLPMFFIYNWWRAPSWSLTGAQTLAKNGSRKTSIHMLKVP